jgi:hypothetical protein
MTIFNTALTIVLLLELTGIAGRPTLAQPGPREKVAQSLTAQLPALRVRKDVEDLMPGDRCAGRRRNHELQPAGAANNGVVEKQHRR